MTGVVQVLQEQVRRRLHPKSYTAPSTAAIVKTPLHTFLRNFGVEGALKMLDVKMTDVKLQGMK